MLSCGTKTRKAYTSSALWHGETQIYNIGLADNDSLNRLTDGMHDYASLALCGDKLIAKRHSMSMGDEIYAVNNTRSGNAFAKAEQLHSRTSKSTTNWRWVK